MESLLKVFDANYVSGEEVKLIEGFDANNPDELKLACDIVLKDDFLSYTEKEKRELLSVISVLNSF